MRKGHRDAERIIAELGLRVVESYRTKHHTFVVEANDGRRFNVQLSHDTGMPRFWNNWKSQLRRRLNEHP